MLSTNTLKNMEITLFGNTKRLNEKHDFLSVFELLMYQKGKMHAKHPLCRNRITLPKTSILSVFELVTE